MSSLAIMTNLKAFRSQRGHVVFTRKFLDGVREYGKHWDGSISVLMEPRAAPDSNLDHVEWDTSELPFRLEVLPFDSPEIEVTLRGTDLVLVSAGSRKEQIGTTCRRVGTKCVYITELTLKTETQIISANVRNPLRRWVRHRRLARQHAAIRDAVARADGVQCNGIPAYAEYGSLNPRPLLYFDTRVTGGQLVTEAEADRRECRVLSGAPLHLVFSGRLLAIKGVDHLPRVARVLADRGVPFRLSICGSGDREAALRAAIRASGLDAVVEMKGMLDFNAELLPFVKSEADLFLCCHPQGDPSCTYLETLSCGVPIAGYPNEAFAGLVDHSGCGWTSRAGRPEELADVVARLHGNRALLADAARRSRKFAVNHTFQTTFERRIEHLTGILRGP